LLLPSDRFYDSHSEGYYELDGAVRNLNSTPSINNVIEGFSTKSYWTFAQQLHSRIDGAGLMLPEKSYAVVGCKKPTASYIKEQSGGLASFANAAYLVEDGDGIVPLTSAVDMNVGKKYAAQYAVHSNLPSHEGVRNLVRSLLKGYETEFSSGVAEYQPDFCGLDSGVRIICDGCGGTGTGGGGNGGDEPPTGPRITGKKPGEVEDKVTTYTGNKVHLGIIGSDYRFTNEGVEIFVPEGSQYTMEFKGGDKEYLDIKLQLMSEGGVIKTYVFGELAIDIEGCGTFNIDLTNVMIDPVVNLDHECDGVFEETDIQPDYILYETKSQDITAP
jgi:hypothetical protein